MKNDNVKSFAVLVAICVVVAALMGVVNKITSPRIEEIEAEKVQAAMLVVMPQGQNFTKVEFEVEQIGDAQYNCITIYESEGI